MSAAPIPSSPADLELIAQLNSKLQYAEMRIRVLEERLRLMRIEKYGAGGEKLSQAQMQLFMPQRVKTVLQQDLHFILPLSVLFHAPASSIPHNSLKMSLKRGLRERKVFKLESRCPELNISRGAPCAS